MTRPKDIGTQGETAVVRYLRANGFPYAERRALAGANDLGDVTGTPGVCWEVKAGRVAEASADGCLATWQAQLDTEQRNTRSDIGVLVLKRKAVGTANAGRWWAYVRAEQIATLLNGHTVSSEHRAWVRLTLADAVALLRQAGYGTALPEVLS